MRQVYFVAVALLLALCFPVSHAEQLYYANEFVRFLHIPGKYSSGILKCRSATRVVAFFATPERISESDNDPTGMFPTYKQLEDEGVPEKYIFGVAYSKNYSEDNENWLFVSKLSVLHKNSATHIHFTFPDNSSVIHLELVNQKMDIIKDGKLPKNSRYTRVKEIDSDGYLVTAPKTVYLWENDAIDKKIVCDIETTKD